MSGINPLQNTGPAVVVGAALLLAPFGFSAEPTERDLASSRVEQMDVMNRITDSTRARQSAFAPPSPGDSDLGEQLLLADAWSYQPLTLFGSTTQYYTTNASLLDDQFGADWFTLMQVGALYMPRLVDTLYGEISARQDLFRYARHSELSFNSTNLGAGLIYIFPTLGELSVSARYGFNLLTNAAATSQVYREQFLRFGLQKPFILSRAHSLYTGLTAHIALEGNPGFALRDQFLWFAGYRADLTRSVTLDAFYQIGYLPFREGGRSDWNQILSGAVTWNAWRWFSLSALVSASFNSSNDSFYDYSVLNVGGGINASIQF